MIDARYRNELGTKSSAGLRFFPFRRLLQHKHNNVDVTVTDYYSLTVHE